MDNAERPSRTVHKARESMSSSVKPVRLYVSHDLAADSSVALSSDQARYVLQVMRRIEGDAVKVFNGRDGEWQGALSVTGKKTADVRLELQARPQYTPVELRLFFAPVKRTAIDLIAQKATELGVTSLHPVVTARTNADRVNIDRLATIAIAAAEQCGRLSVPMVHAPQSLDQAFVHWPDNKVLYLLDETGDGTPIAQVLQNSATQPAAGAAFVMGPEGGFTDSELDLLRGLPFSKPVSLGPRILRAETAALAALTCWQALCGDWTTAV